MTGGHGAKPALPQATVFVGPLGGLSGEMLTNDPQHDVGLLHPSHLNQTCSLRGTNPIFEGFSLLARLV